MGSERREHVRYAVSLRVRVRVSGSEQFTTFKTMDVSRGGLFLCTRTPPERGTRVSVELADAAGHSMLVPGRVVRTIRPDEAGPRGPGVGVQLGPLSDIEQEMLGALIEQAGGVAAEGSNRIAAADPASVLESVRAALDQLQQQPLYEFLGVPADSAPEDVRRAYLMQSKRWHPSNFSDESREVLEVATSICRQLRRAYEQSPARRALSES
jgi:Tfp pilus assembly protein PilZ